MVIAIIAILAALLMPALEQARNAAYTAKCANNLHQTMLTVIFYQNNYDGAVIPVTYGPGNHWGGHMCGQQLLYEGDVLSRRDVLSCASWGNMTEEDVAPLRGRSPLLCPAGVRYNHLSPPPDANPDTQTGWARWGYPMHSSAGNEPGDPDWFEDNWSHDSATIFFDYGINWYLKKCTLRPDLWLNGREWHSLNTTDIAAHPSRTLYMIEAFGKVHENYMDDLDPGEPQQFAFRHGRMTNYSCLDGHVDSLNKDLFRAFEYLPKSEALDQLPFVYDYE